MRKFGNNRPCILSQENKEMLDIKFIREYPEIVKQGCKKRQAKVDIDFILDLDEKRQKILIVLEGLRAQKNKASREIRTAKNEKEKQKIISGMQKLDKKSDRIQKEFKKINQEFKESLLWVPIPPAPDVPDGKTEEDNLPIRHWGKPIKFDFEPRDYISLMESLDLLDLRRGAKIGGFRQYIIKNEAVLLEQALLRWSLDFLRKKGFTLFRPTIMVKKFALIGTGMFPKGEKDAYAINNDLFLAGTTEAGLMAYYADEILNENQLPIKMLGISEAFRKEAGSYGKDMKGILRVHEFWQTEQVIICKNDKRESIKWHENLLNNSEEMMQLLELPYRVVNCCAGDLADGQVKRYDIEVWIPSQGKYRETHSDSYLFDFQARRLNIRYRTKDNKLKFAHSLNNTGIAVPRILIPIIENYQQKDGSIKIPKVLQRYLDFKVISSKR